MQRSTHCFATSATGFANKAIVCCITQAHNELLMCCRWAHIQGALAEHRGKLATALEVHAFNRDVDDLNERINEKVLFHHHDL